MKYHRIITRHIRTHTFIRCALSLLLSAVLLLAGCANQPAVGFESFEGTHWMSNQPLVEQAAENRTLYQMELTLNTDAHTLTAYQNIDYIHNGAASTRQLYFHLYPNAFTAKEDAPFSEYEWGMAYPNGFSPGSLEIGQVVLDGENAQWSYADDGRQILCVDLPQTMNIGDTAALQLQYTVTIPNNLGRFGYGEWTYNLCNFYPIAAMMDSDGYKLDPYYSIGDPFYSETANYQVTLHVPADYIVASSGGCLSESVEDGVKTYSLEAMAVRDFAFVASAYFGLRSMVVGDTCVTSYYLDPDKMPERSNIASRASGDEALRSGVYALQRFNELYGQYPYGNFNVVQTDFFIGGMEYPGMVLIDKSLYEERQREGLYTVVIHETAHQWWYAMVGNNEVDIPFLDEALADYSTHVLMKEFYDQYDPGSPLEDYRLYEMMDFISEDQSLTRSIYGYNDMFEYDALVYKKGTLMYIALGEYEGEEALHKALKKYFSAYQFEIATLPDLQNVIQEELGDDALKLMNAFLDGSVVLPHD